VRCSFSGSHQPNANETVELRIGALTDLLALGHPALADFTFPAPRELATRLARAQFRLLDDDGRGAVGIERRARGIRLASKGDGPSASEQRKVAGQLERALAAIQKGKKASEFKEVFAAARKLNRAAVVHRLELRIPSLGLRKGQAAILHLGAVDENTGRPKGGITLLVTA